MCEGMIKVCCPTCTAKVCVDAFDTVVVCAKCLSRVLVHLEVILVADEKTDDGE